MSNEINIKYLSQRTENIIAICEIALLCFVVIAYLISKAMVSIDELKSASDTLLMIVIIRLIYDISEDIKFKRMYKKQQVKNND